jgi:hypothetical protein
MVFLIIKSICKGNGKLYYLLLLLIFIFIIKRKWNGPEPLNLRVNSYTSIILFNMVHNITYASTKVFSIN